MRNATPLPAQLAGRAFTAVEGAGLGLTTARLRASDLIIPSRGLRVPVAGDDLVSRCAALLELTPDAWVSHVTAATLWGLAVPRHLLGGTSIDLTRSSDAEPPRRRDIRGHSSRVAASEVTRLQGLRVSSPGQTWFDLLTMLGPLEAIVIGDQLLRRPRPRWEQRSEPYCSGDDIDRLLEQNRRRRGIGLARLVRSHLRVGADSPAESIMRMALFSAGLPEAELQLRLDPTDSDSDEGDLGYREHRIVIQYDGEHHLTREQQTRDIRRDQRWVDAGWRVIRCDVNDLRDRFRRVIRQLGSYLADAA